MKWCASKLIVDQSTLLVAITEANRKEEKKVIENGIVENSMLGMLDRGWFVDYENVSMCFCFFFGTHKSLIWIFSRVCKATTKHPAPNEVFNIKETSLNSSYSETRSDPLRFIIKNIFYYKYPKGELNSYLCFTSSSSRNNLFSKAFILGEMEKAGHASSYGWTCGRKAFVIKSQRFFQRFRDKPFDRWFRHRSIRSIWQAY